MQITYDQIRAKMDGPYNMTLCRSESAATLKAVNIGIDARLEACFVPDRGDSYNWEKEWLVCRVSPESLPVLIRRLTESDVDIAESLASDILTSLGFNVETACFEIV